MKPFPSRAFPGEIHFCPTMKSELHLLDLLHQWHLRHPELIHLLVVTAVAAVWELLHLNMAGHLHHQIIMDVSVVALNCESTRLVELKVGVPSRIHLHHHLQQSMDLLINVLEAGLMHSLLLHLLGFLDINDRVAGVDENIPLLSIL
jgi:hypothetical protein